MKSYPEKISRNRFVINTLKSGMFVLAFCGTIPFVFGESGGIVTPKVANSLVLLEVQAEALGIVGMFIGADPGQQLPWSGTFGDTDWGFKMSTAYRDGTLTMNYTGNLALATDLDTWTGTGRFSNSEGTFTWSTTGSYTDARIDGNWFASILVAGLTVVGDIAIGGVQVLGTTASGGSLGGPAVMASVGAIGTLTAVGINKITELNTDKFHGTVHEEQGPVSGPFLPPFPLTTPPFSQPPYPAIAVDTEAEFLGTEADSIVPFTAYSVVSAVPESSTYGAIAALFGISLVGIRSGKRRRLLGRASALRPR